MVRSSTYQILRHSWDARPFKDLVPIHVEILVPNVLLESVVDSSRRPEGAGTDLATVEGSIWETTKIEQNWGGKQR